MAGYFASPTAWGHRDGHVASNAIVSVLKQTLDLAGSFEDKIESATRAIESVNATLHAQSTNDPNLDICGTTVLSLIIDDGYACCLWAGGSRLYLFRDEQLYMVSEDHAEAGGMLTRAVGSAATLEVDRRIVKFQDGDTFLLCSDGLLKGMDETEMADMLRRTGEALADRMLARSIAGGSSDDITAIRVWIGLRDE